MHSNKCLPVVFITIALLAIGILLVLNMKQPSSGGSSNSSSSRSKTILGPGGTPPSVTPSPPPSPSGSSDSAMKIGTDRGVNDQDIAVTVFDKNKQIYKNQNSFPSNFIDYWYIPEDGGSISFKSVSSTNPDPQRTYTSEYLKLYGITNLILGYNKDKDYIIFSQ